MNMNEENFVVPTATMIEKPDAYILKIEVPGIGKEDAELHIDGKTLALKTHAKFQNPAGFKPVSTEFERSNYVLSVDLPEMADSKRITAILENGILRVIIQKRAEAKPCAIEIQ